MKKTFTLLFAPGRLALTIALGLLLTTTAAHATYNNYKANLVERLESDGRFTTLLLALEITGLKDTVANGGPFTILAPTDAAFDALPPGTLKTLVEDVPALKNILLYHAISGRKSLPQLVRDSTTTTLQGNPVLAMTEDLKVRINGQGVDYPSLRASNGVIHPIEGVLQPPAEDIDINSLVDVLALDGRFKTLIAAVTAAGLADTLATGGPFTVFAPTDDAFAALPPGTVDKLLGDIPALKNVLLYHVINGSNSAYHLLRQRSAETLQGEEVAISINRSGFLINKSPVISPNVKAPNGIIHVIGAVLLPAPPKPNMLELLEADDRFDTLVVALKAAGLAEVVATAGPLTLFAPTDDAFDALPPETIPALLADTNALKNVLLYHVVAGSKTASDLLRQFKVTTLQGSSAYVYSWRNNVFVNRSQVIEANICASNGTIHGINKVLLPPATGGNDDEDHEDDEDDND